jgi:methyl-accepting chemotaxis protein
MIEGQARHTAEITKITHLITTISTKTNLLSLNAAIEAARAGEQGKSFAVVAEEIKTLAKGSQNSAKEIGSLIEAIEEETRKVRASMQAGQERVGGGREVVEQARSRLLEIVSLAADTAKASLENYESFQREKEEVASIVKAMQAISRVTDETAVRMEEATAATQQSTATSQEVAKTAQEVARTAEELKVLVGKFKV